MASSSKGLRLLKTLKLLKMRPTYDAATVLKKVELISASDGIMKGSFTIEPTMCNIGGTLHGGYIASVADVFSFYSQLSNPDGRISWTTTLNVTYSRPAKEGETVHVETKSLGNANCPIIETYFHNDGGQLLAKGTTTFIAGNDKYQEIFKNISGFDVFQQFQIQDEQPVG